MNNETIDKSSNDIPTGAENGHLNGQTVELHVLISQ